MRWMIVFVLVACQSHVMKQSSKPMSPVEKLRATLAAAGIDLRLATADREPILVYGTTLCVLESAEDANVAMIERMARSFARYPSNVLANVGIDHVAVCRELTLEREFKQSTAGLADHESRALLVNLSRLIDPSLHWADQIGDGEPGEVVHHELFHLLERAHAKERTQKDPEWERLNPVFFTYSVDEQDLAPGFLNWYAMTRLAEDKAVIYQELMVRPDWLCEKAAADVVLRAKIGLLWRRVRTMTGTDSFLREHSMCALPYSE